MSAAFGRENSPVLYVAVLYWTQQRTKSVAEEARRFTPEERKTMMLRIIAILQKVEPDELGLYYEKIRAWWD